MALHAVLAAHNGLGYLALHAVQFGAQPLLAKRCIAKGTPVPSLVLGAEAAKVIACLGLLKVEGKLQEVARGWSFKSFLMAAGLPSLSYLLQNLCIQVAYQQLDGIVFNILNQTKMLFTAFFVYLILGRRQSPAQCCALLLLSFAGVLVSLSEAKEAKASGSASASSSESFWMGICCIVSASALSGFGGAVSEWVLQREQRNSYLFSCEMAVLGCSAIFAGRFLSHQQEEGLFERWTGRTLIPILTQGWGGIVVGLIAKTSGSVRKGFAVMVGLLLTCLLKWAVEGKELSWSAVVAVPLVALSIYLHARYPPQPLAKRS
ncbi:ROCK1 [Symbiodinium sp. CCMP2592]|nr:ROCK1 [Symbiodinium sp. CCMP2592]